MYKLSFIVLMLSLAHMVKITIAVLSILMVRLMFSLCPLVFVSIERLMRSDLTEKQ